MYWVGQKVRLGLSIGAYGKTWKNFLTNPIVSTYSPPKLSVEASSLQTQESSPWCVSMWWEGNGSPLQDSCLENPMDRGAWRATVHEAARSGIQLSLHTLLSVARWLAHGSRPTHFRSFSDLLFITHPPGIKLGATSCPRSGHRRSL